MASPSLPLSCLAQPSMHTLVFPGPQRDQGSSSCIQHCFCMPDLLPLLSHKLLMSKIPDLSHLPWIHQTLSEGTIPSVFQATYLGPVYHGFDRCSIWIVGCVHIQSRLQGNIFTES